MVSLNKSFLSLPNLGGSEILVSHYFPFVLFIQVTRCTVYVPLKEESKGNIFDKSISAYQVADEDGVRRAGNSCAILLSSLG